MGLEHRHRIVLSRPDDFASWRDRASALLQDAVPPDRIDWDTQQARQQTLDWGLPSAADLPARATMPLSQPLAKLLGTALLHSDPQRFAIAYRLLWRMRTQPLLYENPADPDSRALASMAQQVRRDIHKMHAFVRFRQISLPGERDRFVAWFEPDHAIERAAAPFFRNRFTGMDWTIVTPRCTLSWDRSGLAFGPGGSRCDVPDADAIEAEWRAYYASIFNPARLKVQAMKSEMPVKYWRNLPEASLISPLIDGAAARTRTMIKEAAMQDDLFANGSDEAEAKFADLAELYESMAGDASLPRVGFSDRLIAGEGPPDARIMLVGEQPGDMEDRAGRPFVGPAGEVLDHALGKSGLDRAGLFITNAVKRFKFEQRGKRRLHQSPSAEEIAHYRWWLQQEIGLVSPEIVVALGKTAAEALTGKKVTITRERGALRPWGSRQLLVTVHPSFILRLPDREAKIIEYKKFVRDLHLAA